MSSRSERYHALDALRGFAMFLGVLLHAAIAYTFIPVSFWPVNDPRRSNLFDLGLLAIHDFRMQLFFLLAGFFGCLLYARYGVGGTARHRLKRVALPLLLAMLTIQPALQAVSIYARDAAKPSDKPLTIFGKEVPRSDTPLEAMQEHFTSGRFLELMIPAHLWFLWFLLLCFTVVLPFAWLGDRIRSGRVAITWDFATRWLFQSRWRWLILGALTWVLLLPMTSDGVVDTPLSWIPTAHLLGYYVFFFTVGWTLYRQRDLLDRFVRGWQWALAVGNLLVFPTGMLALYLRMKPDKMPEIDSAIFHLIALAFFGLYTWLSIAGLTGLFLRYLSRERAWVRWLADSSYWCYLASLPPIIFFQLVLMRMGIPAPLKFAIVSVTTMVLLLVSYRYCVRYTAIGRLLNGRRDQTIHHKLNV